MVTYNDMMEMLTNYDYTIDVTSDAGGEAEIWGNEAGYGIISAEKMLGWVAANCHESCSGEVEELLRLERSEQIFGLYRTSTFTKCVGTARDFASALRNVFSFGRPASTLPFLLRRSLCLHFSRSCYIADTRAYLW